MENIIKKENFVAVRLDNAWTNNEKYLIAPKERENGTKGYFGDFKFKNPLEVKALLQKAVQVLCADCDFDVEDNVFEGPYPYWIYDDYGYKLKVQNRVKFYPNLLSSTLIPDDEIRKHNYSLEVHLSITKKNTIYLFVSRAIATSDYEAKSDDSDSNKYSDQNELFVDTGGIF